MKRPIPLVAVLILPATITGCGESGQTCKDQLLKAISQADAVIITEHSYPDDFIDEHRANPPQYDSLTEVG